MSMTPSATAQRRANWSAIYGVAALVLLAVLAFLIWATPVTSEGGKDWFAPMIPGGWMAWTFPVALFFWIIATLLVVFTILAIRFPETPRRGILRFETTRGDRLFITLLGSAFICLAWLFLAGPALWWGLALCVVWAVAIFALV